MEVPGLLLVVFQLVPVDHHFLDPLPPHLHPPLRVVPLRTVADLLGLRTEALDHRHELRYEVGHPAWVLHHILLNHV